MSFCTYQRSLVSKFKATESRNQWMCGGSADGEDRAEQLSRAGRPSTATTSLGSTAKPTRVNTVTRSPPVLAPAPHNNTHDNDVTHSHLYHTAIHIIMTSHRPHSLNTKPHTSRMLYTSRILVLFHTKHLSCSTNIIITLQSCYKRTRFETLLLSTSKTHKQ